MWHFFIHREVTRVGKFLTIVELYHAKILVNSIEMFSDVSSSAYIMWEFTHQVKGFILEFLRRNGALNWVCILLTASGLVSFITKWEITLDCVDCDVNIQMKAPSQECPHCKKSWTPAGWYYLSVIFFKELLGWSMTVFQGCMRFLWRPELVRVTMKVANLASFFWDCSFLPITL